MPPCFFVIVLEQIYWNYSEGHTPGWHILHLTHFDSVDAYTELHSTKKEVGNTGTLDLTKECGLRASTMKFTSSCLCMTTPPCGRCVLPAHPPLSPASPLPRERRKGAVLPCSSTFMFFASPWRLGAQQNLGLRL